MHFRGVIPAITTPFSADLEVDVEGLVQHARILVEAGVTGIVPLGSLGEGATLGFDEKVEIVRALASSLPVPVAPGISSLSTAEAVRLAQAVRAAGARGLMVLPPYVYPGDARELEAHVDAVIGATDLPCLLYNNPIAYGADFRADQIARLAARHGNLAAVKESSGDVRRITALRERLEGRIDVLVGLDDLVVEGVLAGAVGWIAGLVNALPHESVRLFELAQERDLEQAWKLYRWFLPLLRLDTVPKFVQLIKLAQQQVGLGSEQVRPPRLPLEGEERRAALALIDQVLAERP